MEILFLVLAVAVVAIVVFYLGARYGGSVWQDTLNLEREAADKILADRDAALSTIRKMKDAVAKAGLDLKTVFPFLCVLLMLAWASGARAQAHYQHDGAYRLPDARYTPGAVDPLAVADLSGARHTVGGIERNVCAKDFRTAPIRASIHNFAGLKKKACAEYGAAKCDGSVEGDHLISLEIGGCPDCLTNVWPEPMAEARIKDHQVEDVLPRLVCAGKLTLRDAQRCVAGDWASCGSRIGKIGG
jgi:hypothetical protein